jgi:hypothetical protein
LPFWAVPVWKVAAPVGPQDRGETATLFVTLKGQKSLKKMVSSWLDNASQLRVGLADGYQADGVEEFVNGGLNLHRQGNEGQFPGRHLQLLRRDFSKQFEPEKSHVVV